MEHVTKIWTLFEFDASADRILTIGRNKTKLRKKLPSIIFYTLSIGHYHKQMAKTLATLFRRGAPL